MSPKTFLTILAMMLLFPQTSGGAQCPSGDVLLETQSEVSDFLASYPNCTKLPGDLEITDDGSNADDIVDAEPLAGLVSIGGTLRIEGTPSLVTIELPALASLGEMLVVRFNDALEKLSLPLVSRTAGQSEISVNHSLATLDLSSLTISENLQIGGSSLTSLHLPSLSSVGTLELSFLNSITAVRLPSLQIVTGALWLDQNPVLETLDAPRLEVIEGSVSLSGNDALSSFELPELESYVGFLGIGNNPVLTRVGLPALEKGGASLDLYDNPLVVEIETPRLESMEGSISIRRLDGLTSLSFPRLGTVPNFFDVQDNPRLECLALSSLTGIGEGFFVFRNENLDRCCSLTTLLAHGDPSLVQLGGNAAGCNSIPEIEAVCPPPVAGIPLFVGECDRFRVTATWEDSQGQKGRANWTEMTRDFGYATFFGPDNIEMQVKVLDGSALFDDGLEHFWVFAAGATNVGVELKVEDTFTRTEKSFLNPVNRVYRTVADTGTFVSAPSFSGGYAAPESARVDLAQGTRKSAGEPILLNDGRFRVETTWTNFEGTQGQGIGLSVTSDSGFFWFFGEENIELQVKVLDASALYQDGLEHFWVFAAGLTNVGVEMRVIDTVTGEERMYFNPVDRVFETITDTDGFVSIPAPLVALPGSPW